MGKNDWTPSGGLFDIEEKLEAIARMEEQTMAPGFWDDRQKAQELLTQISRRREVVKAFSQTESLYNDGEAAVELALDDLMKRVFRP